MAKRGIKWNMPASLRNVRCRTRSFPPTARSFASGPGLHEVVGEVPSGRLGLDGKMLRRMDREASKSRRKMSYNGAVVITLVMDGRGGVIQNPQIALMGVGDAEQDPSMPGDITALVLDAVEAMPKSTRSPMMFPRCAHRLLKPPGASPGCPHGRSR